MKNTLLFLAIIIASSCRPTADLSEHTKIVVKDSIVERKVPIYVNVPVYLQGDTIRVKSKPIVIREPLQLLNVDPIWAYGTLASSKAWVKDNLLYNELTEKDTTLQARYDSLVTVFDRYKTTTSTSSSTTTVVKTKNSWFAKFCIKWFWITLAIIALTLITKFYNPLRR